MKKLIKYIGILLVGLLIAMFLVPFVYEAEIIEELKKEVNKEIDGNLDFEEIDISFFKSFPDVAVSLKDMTVSGNKTKKSQNLIQAESLTIDLELMSFLTKSEQQIINNITVENADINLYHNRIGVANYDLSKSSTANSSAYQINLNSYEIIDSDIQFIDDQNKTTINLKGVDHEGKGNFTEAIYDLNHTSKISSANLEIDGVNYLNKLPIKADLITKIDKAKSKYSIETKSLLINKLQLDATGFVKMNDTGFDVDINLGGVNEKLTDLLSVIPGIFKSNINDLKVDGFGSFDGAIKGQYNSKQNIKPSIDFNLKSKDGEISSISTQDKISNLNSEINIKANNGSWSDLAIQIPNFSAIVDDQTVTGRFTSSDFMTDPLYDAALNGLLDLEKIQNLIAIESINSIKGKLDIDLSLKGRQSDILAENYEALEFNNTSKSNGPILIDFKDKPDLNLNAFELSADKHDLNVKGLTGTIGKSDFIVDSSIKNPLVFLTKSGETTGKISLKSDRFDLNEFVSAETDKSNVNNQLVPSDQLALNLDVDIDHLLYDAYDIKQLKAKGNARINSIQILQSNSIVNGSKVSIKGELDNTYAFAMSNDTLLGKLSIASPDFDSNKFIHDSGDSKSTEPTRIPKNVSLLLDLVSNKLKYEDYNLSDFNSEVIISNGRAIFSNSTAKAFDGKISVDGIYDSAVEEPSFSFSYDIDNFSFKSFYSSSDLFRKLAPVAEYIDGHFNSNLSMSATLKDGFNLDFSSLSADGFLETIHGSLNNYLPIEAMAEKLGVANISEIAIDKTKNWFTIKDGAVLLKDHDYEYQGIKLNIGGSHKLNQNINYQAKLEIPRALFKNNNGAAEVIDGGLDKLSKEASALGVDIFSGDYIYANVNIGGSVLKPKIKVTPTGSGGKSLTEQAKEEITERAIEIKDEYVKHGKEKTEEVKDTLTTIVTTKIDTLENQVESVIKDKTDELTEKIGEVITSKVDSTVSTVLKDSVAAEINKKLEDILKSKTEETDKLKDKLKDFKIFKKNNN